MKCKNLKLVANEKELLQVVVVMQNLDSLMAAFSM
jgi:hypothetical protein